MWSWTLISSLMALVGTVMQARAALRELAERDPGIGSALAIDDLRREVPRWRLLRRRRHLRAVDALMAQSPAEAAAYRRVRSTVLAWSVLATSALVATIASAAEAFVAP